jgi:two-component system, NarL family, sensor kinase
MQAFSGGIGFFVIAATIILLLLAIFIVSMMFVYQKKKIAYEKKMEALKSEFEKTLLSTQLEIQEQTFQHISREIHDHICLNLTLAKLNLVTIDPGNRQQLSDRINSSTEILSRSIHELSDISHSMNPEIIESNGLIAALELEIGKMKKLNLFEINLNINGHSVYMDSLKELFIFRIIQEAFNNILKHAKAKNVLLNLCYRQDHLEALVQDDGQGFLATEYSENGLTIHHSGLKNMRKRALLIKGNCEIISEPEKGTKIKLSVPY